MNIILIIIAIFILLLNYRILEKKKKKLFIIRIYLKYLCILYSHFKVFGCRVFFFVPKSLRNKFDNTHSLAFS